MSFAKTLTILVAALLSVSANAVDLPSCPPTVTLLQDTEGAPNLFFMADDGKTLVSHQRAPVLLNGFGFYSKVGASVTELAPNKNLQRTSEYVFGPIGQILFACGYSGGAVLLHELPIGSVKSCVIRDNLKKSRSVTCR